MSARRLPGPHVALTPGALSEADVEGFLPRALAAIEAGLDAVLVREPGLSDRSTLRLARALRERLGPRGWLAVHDRVHLAPSCGADAVHLGWRSLPPGAARAILPDAVAIGLSAHGHDDPALWSHADLLTFGPVLDTPSKRGLLEPTGFAGLARAVRASAQPVWALGGMRPEHAAPALAAGARGLAALGGLLASPDPAAAARAYLAALR